MKWLAARLRLLPLMIMVAMLAFTVRVGDFITTMRDDGAATAQEEVSAQPPPLPAATPEAAKPAETHAEEAAPKDATLPAPKVDAENATALDDDGLPAQPVVNEDNAKPVEWKDAGNSDFDYSEVQAGLYKDLSKRREELDQRETEITQREALLSAGERELDQKLRELTTIKNEIQGLLQTQSEEEKARLDSLVKIYEGMKAKDAARIFNTLEIDVLLRVMTEMSERKSAPILAEMEAERARTLTMLLAQQRQLPSVPME